MAALASALASALVSLKVERVFLLVFLHDGAFGRLLAQLANDFGKRRLDAGYFWNICKLWP